MMKEDKRDLDEACFFHPLLSNSPLSSSWDLTARLLRLRKKFRASSSFMKIFFIGPAVKAGVSTHHTKQKDRFRASHQSYVHLYGRTRLLSGTRETLCERTSKWDDLPVKRHSIPACFQTILLHRLTGKRQKHSEQSQQDRVRAGHLWPQVRTRRCVTQIETVQCGVRCVCVCVCMWVREREMRGWEHWVVLKGIW